MTDVWIANASPIIVLAKVGHLELLEQSGGKVLLPEAVAIEILSGPPSDPARQAIENGWGARVRPSQIPHELLEWGLGPGETAVLSVARERAPCTAVLDDAAARACAKVFRVPVIGTLGVVLRAKRRGLIPAAATVLRDLQTAGLYLDEETIRLSLERVGESWN